MGVDAPEGLGPGFDVGAGPCVGACVGVGTDVGVLVGVGVSVMPGETLGAGADVGDAPAPVVIEQAPEPVDWGAVAADAVEQAIDRLIPPGQHRADAQTTLDALREGLAVKE